jgi:hypothetical protein
VEEAEKIYKVGASKNMNKKGAMSLDKEREVIENIMPLMGQVSYTKDPGVSTGPRLLIGSATMHFESYDINLVRAYFTLGPDRVAPPPGLVIIRDDWSNGTRPGLVMEPLGPDGMYFLLSRNHDYDIRLYGTLLYKLCDSHTLLVHRYTPVVV